MKYLSKKFKEFDDLAKYFIQVGRGCGGPQIKNEGSNKEEKHRDSSPTDGSGSTKE